MAGRITYHSLYCREISVDQRTGELRYETASPDMPVAQFIGPKPLSEKCNSFSIEIAHPGMKSFIAIGLCHRRYPGNRQPGWETNSIGYHADDGGIYHHSGHPKHKFGRVRPGGVMGCSFNFINNTVTFFRDGTQVYTSPPLQVPPGGFYPMVGLHSHGEAVCLLEPQPWTPDTEPVPQSEEVVYHSLFCREARVTQSSGIVRYDSMSPEIPVGQFVSECPLSPQCNKFSIEIASQGHRSCIAIGVCHRRYPANRQPGWYPNSIAYHADDGGIFHANGQPCDRGPRARAGDTMSCELDFSTNKVLFRRNDALVYRSPSLRIPPGGFHAAVGFHSHGEAVCLLEKEPWRSAADEQFLPPPVETRYNFSACNQALLNQASGILSYTGGRKGPVAQLISKCPLTPECNSFSIEILNPGKKCCIAIGLCPQNYPVNNQPGWRKHSIGYHADDGGLYDGNGHAVNTLPIARQGAVMTCRFNFADNSISFYNSGKMVYQRGPLTAPPGGFYAAVGLHSEYESVRLCETEPWRDEDTQEPGVNSSLSPPQTPATPNCSICMDKCVDRFLIPCGHTFCWECIEEWSAVQQNCPTCRLRYQEVKTLYFG